MNITINSCTNKKVFKSEPLILTDYWFLFGMWVMIFWAIDPLGWKIDFIAVIKQIPAILIAPAFILSVFGRNLFTHVEIAKNENEINVISNIIIIFSILVIAGSLTARFIYNIQNSFLTMGLYALTAPLTAWFVRRSKNPTALIKSSLVIYIFWALISTVLQTAYYSTREIYHAREHLVISSFIFFFLFTNSKINSILALTLVLASAIVAKKNSAYLTVILIFIYVIYSWSTQHSEKIKNGMERSMFWIKIQLASIFGGGLIYLLYTLRNSSSPTGNPEYRLHTYELAWNKFMNSPIWGNGFTGAATEKFDKFSVAVSTQILPTHSDPLDIMANGGLIGIILWASIFMLLLKRWYNLIKNPNLLGDSTLLPYVHTFYCMIFSGVLISAFNPILNSPNLAWSFWALVGFILATPTISGRPTTRTFL